MLSSHMNYYKEQIDILKKCFLGLIGMNWLDLGWIILLLVSLVFTVSSFRKALPATGPSKDKQKLKMKMGVHGAMSSIFAPRLASISHMIF